MYNRQSFYFSFVPLLLHLALSDATTFPPLTPRAAGYANHDPHLNESQHDVEFFTFLSRPDITHAPRWDVQIYDRSRVSPGYWFISPYASFVGDVAGPLWTAPHIYDSDGELIWFGGYSTGSWTASDFRVSNVNGQPMLTFLHHRTGQAFLLDEGYNVQQKVDLTEGDRELLNGHEFALVDDGSRALHFWNRDLTATREESAKIGFEGNCSIHYHGFRELDVQSWKPTFEWFEKDHLQLEETYATQESEIKHCATPDRKSFDFSHLNAMHKFPDGDFLVSSRRTFTLYKVSHTDGSIVWRLGGKRSDFQLDTAWTGQHGARVQSQNRTHIIISFLDNAKFSHEIPPTHENSRALFLALHITEQPMRASTILSIDQPYGEYNAARGNVQVHPNGNIWACWVTNCLWSEHDKDGNILMKAQLKPAFTTYRSYKYEWKGLPSTPPDVHAAAVAKDWKISTKVYVSWNGATEVKRWRLWHSDVDGKLLSLMASTHWQGFESSMESETFAQYVVVEALDGNGRKLGHSDVIRTLVPNELADAAAAAEREWRTENVADETAPSSTTHQIYEAAQNPVVQIVGGVIMAVAILAMTIWLVLRLYKRRNQAVWWNSQEKAYEPVSTTED